MKHALRALAARWRTLSAEIDRHDELLDILTRAAAPTLREAFGIGPDSAAEMLIVAGDNPTRIRSEAAFAKLCGACPIPASSGVTNRHRLFRGGHRQANAALYRIVIIRMRWHQPTLDYVRRRTAEGLSKKDIIRCLKRFVAREIYHALIEDHQPGATCGLPDVVALFGVFGVNAFGLADYFGRFRSACRTGTPTRSGACRAPPVAVAVRCRTPVSEPQRHFPRSTTGGPGGRAAGESMPFPRQRSVIRRWAGAWTMSRPAASGRT